MSESKHTPGPWLVVHHRSKDRRTPIEVRAWNTNPNAAQGPLVCKIAQPYANRGEAFDNAALIAAAPDLLEVLGRCEVRLATAVEKHFTSYVGDKELLADIRAAIAKAKGCE